MQPLPTEHAHGLGRGWRRARTVVVSGLLCRAPASRSSARGLTLRSTPDPARRAALPAEPPWFIIGSAGKAARPAGPVSSNVRRCRVRAKWAFRSACGVRSSRHTRPQRRRTSQSRCPNLTACRRCGRKLAVRSPCRSLFSSSVAVTIAGIALRFMPAGSACGLVCNTRQPCRRRFGLRLTCRSTGQRPAGKVSALRIVHLRRALPVTSNVRRCRVRAKWVFSQRLWHAFIAAHAPAAP